MKNQVLCMLSGFFALAGCEQLSEPQVTSFQLEIKDYFTGDSMPNVPFSVTGVSSLRYNFEATTNAYGRFDTMMVHEHQTDFNCNVESYASFYTAANAGLITSGKNTEVVIETLSYANFAFNFDCSGPGGIKNVKREFVTPFTPAQNVSNHAAALPQFIGSVSCNPYSNSAQVFSGTWAISYEKQNTTSSSVWYTLYDTVYVAPGESFLYSIVY